MRQEKQNVKNAKRNYKRKLLAVFLVFFMGTSGLLSVDAFCKQTTGKGGELSLEVKRMESGGVSVQFLGREAVFEF